MNNIYIVRTYGATTSYIKLGYSNDIFKRLDAYYAHNPLIEVVGTAYVEDGLLFEQDLHSRIDSVIRKEWYSEDKLNLIINMISQAGGVFEEDVPIKPEKPIEVKISYKEMVDIYNKNNDLKDLDNYQYKSEYYNVIEQCVKLYNKTWKDYTYALNRINNYSNEYGRLIYDIYASFKIGEVYTTSQIKSKLQSLYKSYGITKTAKATDLKEFFELGVVSVKKTKCTKILSKLK